MQNTETIRIVRSLQKNPSFTKSGQAKEAGMSLGAFQRRLDRLVREGVVRRKQAVIDWSALGFNVKVFLRVTLDKTNVNAWSEFLLRAKTIEEIKVIETLVGRVDVRMDVLARDLAHYQEIYVEKILTLPHIADIESLLLISEIKDTRLLPL